MKLNAETLSKISIAKPGYDRDDIQVGIVHFGVGGFHRAHQAMYVDRLLDAGTTKDWGICGVGVLPSDRRMADVMAAQDGLYTLMLEYPDDHRDARVIGSIVDYRYAPDDRDGVVELIAAPSTRIVSLTITEGGYSIEGAGPTASSGSSPMRWRCAATADLPSVTIVSCDNIEGNGDVAREAFTGYAERSHPGLPEWMAEHTRFPNSMVDRITPATTPDVIDAVAREFDVDDEWPVVAEPFTSWVLEDDFSGDRPTLEDVGVLLVDDVTPYELMKLRLLNASHQSLCYFAYLAGYRLVHDAAGDPLFARFLLNYMDSEATPTLLPVPGIDLPDYKQTLIERFANPGVRDTVARLCYGSSDRIPKWLLPVIRENLAIRCADPSVGGDGGQLGPLRGRHRRGGRAHRRPGPTRRKPCPPGQVAARQTHRVHRAPGVRRPRPARALRRGLHVGTRLAAPQRSARHARRVDGRPGRRGSQVSARALVIGEALIDIVERDGQVLGEHVGGSPLNVAIGLGRLGRGVDFLTHIGDDANGRRIVDYVEESGVQLVSGSKSAAAHPDGTRQTRCQRRGAVRLRHPLGALRYARGRARRRRAHRVDRRVPRAGLPGDGRVARRVSRVGHDHVRPQRAAGSDRRPRRRPSARIDRLVERADVVKASDEDLRWIDPNRTPEEIAQAWLATSPVDRGGDDGRARRIRGVRGGHRHGCPHVRCEVVDTVGAGDAFMTGLIDALWSLDLLGAERRATWRTSTLADAGGRGGKGSVGGGVDGRPRGRGPARSRRTRPRLTRRAPYWACVRSGRVPSPSAW